MKILSESQKEKIISSIVWDYQVQGDRLLEVLLGWRNKEGPFDQEKLFIRVLERLPWHDILEIMGKGRVKRLLTPAVIKKLRFPEQRNRYERIRKILQGEPLSFTRWDPRHIEKYQSSLLSNRWHRFK